MWPGFNATLVDGGVAVDVDEVVVVVDGVVVVVYGVVVCLWSCSCF